VKLGTAPRTSIVEPDVLRRQVPALGAADDVPEPGHVDVLRAVLRDPAGSRGSTWFRRGPRPGWARCPVAVVVLVASLAVLPVTHWVAAVARIVYRGGLEGRCLPVDV